ncbi:MAG: YkgJ family cysteine cluster protein [Bryobacteraceae bacterium]|nr:YkgJ family cysteine cluster protein [Bryobacteraceae bacterium]
MLVQIEQRVDERIAALVHAYRSWPCAKGCDDCCRSLAAEPSVNESEWRRIVPRLNGSMRERIRASAGAARPVVCPLLDTASGACLIYDARPTACRTYGFYAERGRVLGCHRIEAIAATAPDLVWGNQAAVDHELAALGLPRPLSEWLADAGNFCHRDGI